MRFECGSTNTDRVWSVFSGIEYSYLKIQTKFLFSKHSFTALVEPQTLKISMEAQLGAHGPDRWYARESTAGTSFQQLFFSSDSVLTGRSPREEVLHAQTTRRETRCSILNNFPILPLSHVSSVSISNTTFSLRVVSRGATSIELLRARLFTPQDSARAVDCCLLVANIISTVWSRTRTNTSQVLRCDGVDKTEQWWARRPHRLLMLQSLVHTPRQGPLIE